MLHYFGSFYKTCTLLPNIINHYYYICLMLKNYLPMCDKAVLFTIKKSVTFHYIFITLRIPFLYGPLTGRLNFYTDGKLSHWDTWQQTTHLKMSNLILIFRTSPEVKYFKRIYIHYVTFFCWFNPLYDMPVVQQILSLIHIDIQLDRNVLQAVLQRYKHCNYRWNRRTNCSGTMDCNGKTYRYVCELFQRLNEIAYIRCCVVVL